MPESDLSIVVLTEFHSIAGAVQLRDQRLSDFLNDRRETVIRLRDVTITRLDHPTAVTARDAGAVVNRDHALVVFEATPVATSTLSRPYAFTLKQSHSVHLILKCIEVRGVVQTAGNLDVYDLHRIVATSGERFLPVTQATVTSAHLEFAKPSGVLVSVQHIDYIAKLPEKT